jgi:hypothetical protein
MLSPKRTSPGGDRHPSPSRRPAQRSPAAVAIEILYFDDCPNHEKLLEHLPRLLEREGLDAEILLRNVQDAASADGERFLGSPTIRVGGRDVDPGAAHRTDYGLKCRIYQTAHGLSGLPPDEWILDALSAHQRGRP